MALSRYTWRTFSREIGLIVLVLIFMVPLYVLASGSLKTTTVALAHPSSLPTSPKWSNFSTAWAGSPGGGVTLGSAFVNSMIISAASVAALVLFGSLCAYALARHQSRTSYGVFMLFVVGIVIPMQLGIIPLYVAMVHLHLAGTVIGMVSLYSALFMPLSVFLYTGFLRAMPPDYEEAAQLDGAGIFRTYFWVVFPLVRPVTATVGILTGLLSWNDFFAPLIFLSGSPHETLPVAIYSFVNDYVSRWNLIFAAVALSVAPVLVAYVFAQRHLVRGFTGGIRG